MNLEKILEEHTKWIYNEGGERADLNGVDLYNANLVHANLRNANLGGADLRNANLRNANLGGAYLCNADLRNANLGGACLSDANLVHADLDGANLRNANLRNTDLDGANLRNSYLYNTYLCNTYLGGADLNGVDLHNTDLGGAHLRGADLGDADLPNYLILPESGSFIGWKKCRTHIVKLEIPEDAKRINSLVGRKCRASKVKVLEVFDNDGNETEDIKAVGKHDSNFVYKEGETVYPDKFDDSILIECTHGIHFFITKKEALEY